MLTLFSVPKPFLGRIGDIQRRSLTSWKRLGDGVQVVLLGDEEGTAWAARDAGAEHVSGLATTEHGTPRLDAAFAAADRVARHPLRCFVNADVILAGDLLTATRGVAERAQRFLLIGQTLDVDDPDQPDPIRRGRRRGAAALDYFVFPGTLYPEVPPFAIGRACFDNWLVWKARQDRAAVVDATADILALHQRHDYGHVEGGRSEVYHGEEAARNLELAGGKGRLYTLHDASHVLRDGRLRRNPGAPLRWRENVRKAAWKLGVR